MNEKNKIKQNKHPNVILSVIMAVVCCIRAVLNDVT